LDDQVEALGRAGRHVRQPGAELDRCRRTRRRELDDPVVLPEREVGVEPPAETLVERLRAIDVGDGEERDLEPERDRRGAGRSVAAGLRAAHGRPPRCGLMNYPAGADRSHPWCPWRDLLTQPARSDVMA